MNERIASFSAVFSPGFVSVRSATRLSGMYTLPSYAVAPDDAYSLSNFTESMTLPVSMSMKNAVAPISLKPLFTNTI